MANLKVVFKNTFLYSSSSLLLRASSIFLFPIFSRYLTESDYGITSITQSLSNLIATFAGLQLGSALTRFAFRSDKEEQDQTKIAHMLRASFTVVFIINVLIFALLATLGNKWLDSVLNDIPFYPFMFFTLLSMPFTAVFDLYKIYLKAQHDGKKVFIIDMLFFGGNIGLNLALVIIFKMGALGIIYSTLANSIVFILYFLIKEPHLFIPKFDFKVLKPLLSYSLTFIPFIFFGFLMENTDRLFLQSKMSSAVSGIYYIAITFASIFSVCKESLVSALTPWFFANFEETNYKRIENLFHIILWGTAIFAVGVSLFGYEVLYVLSSNKKLVDAWQYIPIFVVGLYVVFVGQLCALPIYHSTSAVKYLFIANLTGFVTTLIGCYFFVEKYGLFGASGSKILGYSIMTVTFIAINNATSRFRVRFIYILFPVIFASFASFGNWLDVPYWTKFAIKTVFIVISMAIFGLYAVKSFGGVDQFKELLSGFKRKSA